MAVSILFRPKNRVRAKIFRTFRESFSNFSPSRKFFRRPKNFSNFSWQRCDSFGPKIIKIGAILIIFRPFEISRKVWLLQNFLCGYKIEMAICILGKTFLTDVSEWKTDSELPMAKRFPSYKKAVAEFWNRSNKKAIPELNLPFQNSKTDAKSNN